MALIYSWESFIRIHGGDTGARDVFEKVMDELLRAENPDIEIHLVKASQGDGGIDVYAYKEEGIDIYQCKFFMGSMNSSRWNQIKESFSKAMEPKGVSVLRWVLCMPREMQKEDIAKWDDFKKERASYGVEIQLVDGNEIIHRMQNCDRAKGTDLIGRYFGVPPKTNNRAREALKRRLLAQKANHPSFRLLAGGTAPEVVHADETLMPSAVRLSERYMTYQEEGRESEPVKLSEFICRNWIDGEYRHLQIQGVGGIGKTVTLLSIATEQGFLPYDVPAVYIPLYELNDFAGENSIDNYLQNAFDDETYREILALSKAPWIEKPNLLLLLDGFNEVSLQEKQAGIWREIQRWASRTGTQIITTSRSYNGSTARKFIPITLQELSSKTVIRFLKNYNEEHNENIPVPKYGDRLLHVLKVPLMLTLYVQIESVKEKARGFHYISFKNRVNAGTLIYNFVQKEIYNRAEYLQEENMGSFVFSMTAVLPFIMYSMERKGLFTASEEDIRNWISKAVSHYRIMGDYIPSQVFQSNYGKRLDLSKISIETIYIELTGRSSILIKSLTPDGSIVFRPMHQDFRDGLAALFLYNTGLNCSMTCGAIPKEYRLPQSFYVVQLLSEILDRSETETLWEMNRNHFPTDVSCTNLLLDLIGRQRGFDYQGVNFSDMDLKDISLYPYLDHRRGLPKVGAFFINTGISENSFVPTGHRGNVDVVMISPDNRYILSGASFGDIRIWDIESGACLKIFKGPAAKVKSIVLLSDVQWLVSGSSDGIIRIWDIENEECLKTFNGHADGIRSLAFIPDGRLLASGSSDGDIRIWDIENGNCVKTLKGHTGSVRSVVFVPECRWLVSGSSDGNIRVWDIKSWTCAKVLNGHTNEIMSVAASLDGKHIVSGSSDGDIRVWDTKKWTCEKTIKRHTAWISSVVCSSDGRCIVSGSSDGDIRIWDFESGNCLQVLEGHTDWVRAVSLSSNCKRIVSGSSDGDIRIWDFESGVCLKTLEGYTNGVMSVAVSLDGNRLVSGSSDGDIRVWDLERQQKESCLKVFEAHTRVVRSVAFSPDCRYVVSGSYDGDIRLWDAQDGSCLMTFKGHTDWVRSVALLLDEHRIVSASYDRTIRIWDTKNGNCLNTLQGHRSGIMSMIVSPDGGHIISGSSDGDIRIWSVESGKCLRTIKGLAAWVRTISISPDGKSIVSGSSDGNIRIFDIDSNKCIRVLKGHYRDVESVIISPDGKLIISGSFDGDIRIWDIESGLCMKILQGHAAVVRSVSISNDGRRLVSGSSDGDIRIWDMLSGQCTSVIEPFLGIDIIGVDLRNASFDNDHSKERCRQNGAIVV